MTNNLAIWTKFSFDTSIVRLIFFDLSIVNYIELYREKNGAEETVEMSIKLTYPRSTYPRLTVLSELHDVGYSEIHSGSDFT